MLQPHESSTQQSAPQQSALQHRSSLSSGENNLHSSASKSISGTNSKHWNHFQRTMLELCSQAMGNSNFHGVVTFDLTFRNGTIQSFDCTQRRSYR